MEIRSDILLKRLGESVIAQRSNLAGQSKTKIVQLSPSALWLLQDLQGRSFTEEDAVARLQEHYDVDEQTARRDVQTWIKSLQEADIIRQEA